MFPNSRFNGADDSLQKILIKCCCLCNIYKNAKIKSNKRGGEMAVAKTIDFHSEEYRLGQRIQHIRKKRGLSQTQLGNLMGMDRAAISNYENGSKGEMGFKTLQKFAKALGVTTSVLLGEESEAEKEDKPKSIWKP